MTRSLREERMQQAMADALQSLERVQKQVRTGSPTPGDLYTLRLPTPINVEWVFVLAHPEHADQVFVVPVDDAPLTGTPDAHLPVELTHRPMTARCGQGTWVPLGWLESRLRVGSLPTAAHRLIRQTVAGLARGALLPDPERETVDDDPDYQDWLALIEQARHELEAQVSEPGLVVSLHSFFHDRPPELTSSVGEPAMAAKGGNDLIAGLADALSQADDDLRFHEIPGPGPGKLYLSADEYGVTVLWVGDVSPPPVKGKGAAGRSRPARWRQSVADRPIFVAEQAFPWVDGEVILFVGKDQPQKVSIRQ